MFIEPWVKLSSSAEAVGVGESVLLSVETNLTLLTWYEEANILIENTTATTQQVYPKGLTTTYKVEGTYLGCFASDVITIGSIPPFVAPYLFTPNGDGDNDTWVVSNLNLYDSYTIDIFNRWGNKIISYENNFDSWDGTNNRGASVPIGTYYYVIGAEFGEKEVFISGYVTISE